LVAALSFPHTFWVAYLPPPPGIPLKIRANHEVGQYRSQLFEDLIAALVSSMFPAATVDRDRLLPIVGSSPPFTMDLAVQGLDGRHVFVEVKVRPQRWLALIA
jgi:hypothetical protein